MAVEVNVDSWGMLTETVVNATEHTTIYLTSDIDINEELPTGVSIMVAPKNTVQIRIRGNNHKIKNLATAYSNSGVRIFGGDSTYKIWIYDTTFENVLLQYPNDSFINYSVGLVRCNVSVELAQGAYFTNSGEDTISFYRCGINVNSIGASRLSNCSSDSNGNIYELCNIQLNGTFSDILMRLTNSYISGNLKKVNTGRYKFTGYGSHASVNSIINAAIDMSEADPSNDGRWIFGGSSIIKTLINSDLFNGGEGGGINSNYTRVSTADLKNPQKLRDDYGFPITPLAGD